MATAQPFTTAVSHPTGIVSERWWPALHAMIIDAFLTKDYSVFPPTWTRLDPDQAKGAEGLKNELGNQGIFVVIFKTDGQPIACSGALPFRGENWINEVEEKDDAEIANGAVVQPEDETTTPDATSVPDWETCCFCVHPSQRGQGLAYRLIDELVALIRPRGAKRLISNYAVDETGGFWPKLGFKVIPGAGGMLPKGFQTDPEKEGLRADIYFQMGAKHL
jgi:GNAT superfamily N-acetyltransferase